MMHGCDALHLHAFKGGKTGDQDQKREADKTDITGIRMDEVTWAGELVVWLARESEVLPHARAICGFSFDAATLPPLAEPQVTASRVVTDDTFAVPDAPGAPVCIWTSLAFVPTMSSSAESATVALRP
jgi:hypothetical protein